MKTKIRKPRRVHEKLLIEAQENTVRLEANINYTNFILQSGKHETMAYPLAIYDVLLPQFFIRINKSCIVNKNFIENLNIKNKTVVLKDGTEIQISRRRWRQVRGL